MSMTIEPHTPTAAPAPVLARMSKLKLSRDQVGFVLTALLLLVVFPLTLSGFRLGMVSKYLTYAFPALALVVCWGKGGILSLGQGVFFGLGGYCMAMFLKLEASDPQSTSIQSTPGIPDFMDWNQLTELPFFWVPFNNFAFTLLAVVAVPGVLALGIGLAMFKRRVGGVYFAIITQAIASVLTILIIGQQGYTGGVNGITDLKTLGGWDIRTDSAKLILYYVNASLLLATVLLSTWMLRSKLGRLLAAMREKEERVRFTGYDVASLKVFVFVFAAVVSGIGGLGHLGVQYAKAMGLQVCAVDIDEGKLEHARRLGADAVVNARSGDPAEAVRKVTAGGAHGVLITAPSLAAFKQGIGMTRKHGTCVLVGIPPGEFPTPLFDVVANCITIRGSFVGNRQDMAEALAFAADGKVKADIELQPLSAINRVMQRLEQGDVASRVVLEFAPA